MESGSWRTSFSGREEKETQGHRNATKLRVPAHSTLSSESSPPSLATPSPTAILIGTPTLRSNPYCVSAIPAATIATLPRLFPQQFSASEHSNMLMAQIL